MTAKVRLVFGWLKEAWLVWLTLAVLLTAPWPCFFFGVNEWTIRLAGLWLQCLGMTTTAAGIWQTRLFFNQPSLVQSAKAWFRRFPLRHPPAIVGQMAG